MDATDKNAEPVAPRKWVQASLTIEDGNVTKRDDGAVTARRAVDRETMVAISPLPPPEEVLADWLLSMPHGANLEAAARKQIALIDRRASLHPDVQCLRTLLIAVAGDYEWHRPVANL